MRRNPHARPFSPPPRKYHVAIRNFAVTVDGEQDRYIEGRDRVAPDHPILRTAGENFALEDSPEARRAIARTTSNRSTATPPAEARPLWDLGPSAPPRSREETPRVSPGLSRVKVVLSSSARETIIAEAQASRDGRETGGPIFGRRYFSWHDRLDACIAAGPGHGERERSGLQRDLAHRIALRDEIQRQSGGDFVETGEWHSHPGGVSEPSPLDIRAWLSDLDCFEHSAQLGAILTEDRHLGWASPHFHCYLVSRSRWGEARVERAEIGER